MYERSYHAHVLKQDKDPKKQRSFPVKRVLGIGISIIVIVGVVFLIRVPQFQIREVVVEGVSVADPVEVSDFVLSDLGGNYLFVLPRASIFLSKPDVLAAKVKEHFPRFKSVDVKRVSMHSLRATVVEYPGVYLWCDHNETCSFMDETGTVFADAPYFSGSAYLKIYAGERAPYPFSPLGEGELGMIALIDQKLRSIDITPLEFHMDDVHTLSVHIFHNGNRATILFDPSRDVATALDVLYSGLRTDPLQKMYHDRTKVLEYLDLRFANKVVYKFQ